MRRGLLPYGVLCLLGVIAYIVILDRGAALVPWGDEFSFLVDRRGVSAHSMLTPHNEHLVLFPVAIYKVLLQVGGLEHYWLFRAFAAAVHLLVVGLVFLLIRRRLGAGLAAALVLPVLLMGPGAENVLYPFQIAFTLPLAGGLAAILLLDADDARRDRLACVALVVAVGSSAVGLPFLLAVAAMLGLRRHWQRLWVVAVPGVLYATWRLTQDVGQHLSWDRIDLIPSQLGAYASASAGALSGLGPQWGRALALVVLGLVVRAFWQRRRAAPRLVAYTVFATTLWTLLILTRPDESALSTSRYLYIGGILVLLAVAESVPRPRPADHRKAVAVAAVLGGLAAFAGLPELRTEATRLTDFSNKFQGDMRALEMSRSFVAPEIAVVTGLSPPFTPRRYFSMVDAFGSAALTEEEIDRADPAIGVLADRLLLELQQVHPVPASTRPPAGTVPRPSATTAGTPADRAGCVTVTPTGPAAPEVSFGPPGLGIVATAAADVEVRIWRLGRGMPAERFATVPAGTAAEIRVPADASSRPWKVALIGSPSSTACGLRR